MRALPNRPIDLSQGFRIRDGCEHGTQKKFIGLQMALPVRFRFKREIRFKHQGGQGQFSRGVGMNQAATDRATVACLFMP